MKLREIVKPDWLDKELVCDDLCGTAFGVNCAFVKTADDGREFLVLSERSPYGRDGRRGGRDDG